jgi:hypothetical protein
MSRYFLYDSMTDSYAEFAEFDPRRATRVSNTPNRGGYRTTTPEDMRRYGAGSRPTPRTRAQIQQDLNSYSVRNRPKAVSPRARVEASLKEYGTLSGKGKGKAKTAKQAGMLAQQLLGKTNAGRLVRGGGALGVAGLGLTGAYLMGRNNNKRNGGLFGR